MGTDEDCIEYLLKQLWAGMVSRPQQKFYPYADRDESIDNKRSRGDEGTGSTRFRV